MFLCVEKKYIAENSGIFFSAEIKFLNAIVTTIHVDSRRVLWDFPAVFMYLGLAVKIVQ